MGLCVCGSPNRCAVNAAPGQLSQVQQVVGDFLAGLEQRTTERKPAHPHVVEVRAVGFWAALCAGAGVPTARQTGAGGLGAARCRPVGGAHTCRPAFGLRPGCHWRPKPAVT